MLLDAFWILLTAASLAAFIGTLAGYLSELHWSLELFSHFRLQYLLFSVAAGVLFGLAGITWQASLCALAAVVNFVEIIPLYRRPAEKGKSGDMYRLLLANVLQKNLCHQKLAEVIRFHQPDIVVLIEVNQQWIDNLQPALEIYPYREAKIREDNYGVALFSRFPFRESRVAYFGPAQVPSIVASLDLDGKLLTVIGTHPPPPKSRSMAQERNQQMDEIARFAAGCPAAVILCGDINTTSWSPYFKRFIRHSRLTDSREGVSLQGSWPRLPALLRIPLDHILASDHITVKRRTLGPDIGSDHRPVLLDFSL